MSAAHSEQTAEMAPYMLRVFCKGVCTVGVDKTCQNSYIACHDVNKESTSELAGHSILYTGPNKMNKTSAAMVNMSDAEPLQHIE